MMRPVTPRAISEVASRSPNMPSVLSAVQPTTRMSPGWHCSTATWIIQLSPGCASTVTAVPAASRARPDRAQIGLHQAEAAIGFVHGGDAERAEPFDDIGIGALDVANDDGLHANSSTAIGNSR